jgi:hypothetical protein
MRFFSLSLVACALGTLCVTPLRAANMELGAAITDPVVLQELEQPKPGSRGFRIDALLAPASSLAAPMKNDNLFRTVLSPVARSLTASIRDLPAKSLDSDVRKVFSTSEGDALRFNPKFITDSRSSFQLVGIVNRMDRAYKKIDGSHSKMDNCGEIRFIYRFVYDVTIASGAEVTSRLPITMNVVLDAKAANDPTPCSKLAKLWQDSAIQTTTGKLYADYLRSAKGPLGNLRSNLVDRLEVNFQMLRLPVSDKPALGGDAEYLLKVFRRDSVGKPFFVTTLENQIDRQALLAHPKKLAAFKIWMLRPQTLVAIDQGVLDVPFQYLATQAKSISPGGAARSENQPFQGLLDDHEIQTAIDKVNATGSKLQTIITPGGFKKRLNDYSCSGCHQTRAIAGFHFPGADRAEAITANAVHIPGSAHFFADVPRRKAVIDDFASARPVDFNRGFSGRPLDRYKAALEGTQLFDGWGSVCYPASASSPSDASFSSWTCASGLVCKALHSSSREPDFGVCVTAGAVAIGDPLELGQVTTANFGNDDYNRQSPPPQTGLPAPPAGRSDYVASHQELDAKTSSGGFPAGMLRIEGCSNLPPEAKCGRVAAEGFNKCISDGLPFPECLKKTKEAGLRSCDRANPCRQDYICTAPYPDLPGDSTQGTCIPPYFVFQFRVDGQPSSFGDPNPN